MKWRRTTSNGCPFRSYIARKKNGSMIMIIPMAASVMFPVFFRRKKSGSPTRIAAPKQRIWRLVRFKNNLLFTLVRSLGTFAYRLSNVILLS